MKIETEIRRAGGRKSEVKSGVGKLVRYFVPDISPLDRRELVGVQPRLVFVAESPHVSEIAPEARMERRPLCGMAGRQWWRALGEVVEGKSSEDVDLKRMLEFAKKHRIAVMNSVQYPMDPKVIAQFPEADPAKNLGFAKASGEWGYKKLKKGADVQAAIGNLRDRLMGPGMEQAEIWCLGNDAEWFVLQALGSAGHASDVQRVKGRIPHPSAWWRQGGLFGRIAREKLEEIFK